VTCAALGLRALRLEIIMNQQWRCLFLTLGLFCAYATSSKAGDWPQFRGPNGSAVSAEKALPIEWSAEKNVVWKVKVPGYGWSSPVVWGDKLFVTTAVADRQSRPVDSTQWRDGSGQILNTVYRWEIYCLNATDGKMLWKRTAVERRPAIPMNTCNTYASETPVADGERVYISFGMHGLFCYDFAGNLLWKKDLGTFRMENNHGTGASPAFDGQRLYVQCDNDEKSFLAALDAKTGEQRWRVDRTEVSGWSTPLIWKNKARTEVVCLGRKRVQAYDPATGKALWELGGMNGQAMASPTASDDLLFAGTGGQFGGGRPLFAVKAGAAGDATLPPGAASSANVAWSLPKAGPLVATPLLFAGNLYVLELALGMVNCYDAQSGKQLYRERLPQARGFFASPWPHAGKVFCLDEDGRTFVLQAGAEFKLLGRNDIGETCWASPALSGDAVLLRGIEHLYCIKYKR
jgi:outer membrane protein assembly factor BamB